MLETISRRSAGGDDPADQVLHLGHFLVGDLDPGAGGSLDVDHELARIGPREVGKTHRENQDQSNHAGAEDGHDGEPGPRQSARLSAVEPIEERLEPVIEPGVETGPDRRLSGRGRLLGGFRMRGMAMALDVADQLGAEKRHHRHGHDIGDEERDHHRQRQRGEEVAAHSIEEGHRKEDDGRGEGGGQHRQGHLATTLFRRDLGRFPMLKVTKDIFQHHHRIVD